MKKSTAYLGLFFALCLSLAQPALAQKSRSTSAPSYSYSTPENYENSAGTHHIYGALGFFSGEYSRVYIANDNQGTSTPISGLIAIGADYEYMFKQDFGLGGLFRYYSSKDDVAQNTDYEYDETLFGPYARFHFPNRWFDFAFMTGFAFHTAKGVSNTGGTKTKADTGLKIGPMWGLQLMVAITDTVSVGAETIRLMTLGSEFNGMVSTDYTFKGRFSF